MGVGMNQFGMNTMQNMGNTLGSEGMEFTQLAAQIQASQPNPWALGAQLSAALLARTSAADELPGKGGGRGRVSLAPAYRRAREAAAGGQ